MWILCEYFVLSELTRWIWLIYTFSPHVSDISCRVWRQHWVRRVFLRVLFCNKKSKISLLVFCLIVAWFCDMNGKSTVSVVGDADWRLMEEEIRVPGGDQSKLREETQTLSNLRDSNSQPSCCKSTALTTVLICYQPTNQLTNQLKAFNQPNNQPADNWWTDQTTI